MDTMTKWNSLDSSQRYYMLREVYPDSESLSAFCLKPWDCLPTGTQRFLKDFMAESGDA